MSKRRGRAKNPMQPIRRHNGAVRFKKNAIVQALLDFATPRGMGLNELALMRFSRDDRAQFAQLIGYSLCGYAELSYISDAQWKAANKAAKEQGFGD